MRLQRVRETRLAWGDDVGLSLCAEPVSVFVVDIATAGRRNHPGELRERVREVRGSQR